ncbi:MAG: hypothetical protein WCJ93_10575 [Methanomicrobiales archaeon]
MSKRAVDSVFQAMFLLTDLRVILRDTAPVHELDESQQAIVGRTLVELEEQVKVIRKEMVG